MPRTCTVCAHPALEQNDLPELLQRAYEDSEQVRAKGLVEEIEEQLAIGKNIQSMALENDDLRLALSAIRETRGLLSLLGKARGEFTGQSEAPTMKVFRVQNLPSLDALPPPDATVIPLPTEEPGIAADGSAINARDGEGEADLGTRFTPAQQEAGRVRNKLLGPDRRAARKDWNRTH